MAQIDELHREYDDLGLEAPYKEGLCRYADILLTINETHNLTGAKTPRDFLLKHVADSVGAWKTRCEQLKNKPPAIWDIGSGGGLPGIVVAIMDESLQVNLVERRLKKAALLKEMVSQCGLSGRVRIFDQTFEQIEAPRIFDECWFRGFLPGPKMMAFLSESVRSERIKTAIFMKGPAWPTELSEALSLKKGISESWKDRFTNADTFDYELPCNEGTRTLVVL